MKIGLVTIFQVPNYGSVLQAFATQCLLESLGVDCRIINYKYPNEWHYGHGAKRPNPIKNLIRKVWPSKKKSVLQQFRNERFHLTRKYDSLDELRREDWSSYDAFVVGSDQVWNARFLLGDATFMLSFAPEGKPRFSLASSFASNTIPEALQAKYKKELSRFSVLSVREQNGIDIIKNDLGLSVPATLIPDPTLLLSKEDWLRVVPRSHFEKKRPYILFYMWTYAFEPRPYIFEVLRHYQTQMNADVFALEGFTCAEQACGVSMKDVSTSDIPQFIDLFANADLVITSSFHGTAFALNFGIPVISVVPDDKGDDRQTTLLRSLGMEGSAVKTGTDIRCIKAGIITETEKQKLVALRQESLDWIKVNICQQTEDEAEKANTPALNK